MTLSRRAVRGAALLLLVALAGCGRATGPLSDRLIEVRSQSDGVQVTNRSPDPIHHFLVGRGYSALILWAACVSGPDCPTIAPGATVLVPWPTGTDAPREPEYLFNYWRAVSDGSGGLKADSIHYRIVPR